jgi:hypothetical protein
VSGVECQVSSKDDIVRGRELHQFYHKVTVMSISQKHYFDVTRGYAMGSGKTNRAELSKNQNKNSLIL